MSKYKGFFKVNRKHELLELIEQPTKLARIYKRRFVNIMYELLYGE